MIYNMSQNLTSLKLKLKYKTTDLYKPKNHRLFSKRDKFKISNLNKKCWFKKKKKKNSRNL